MLFLRNFILPVKFVQFTSILSQTITKIAGYLMLYTDNMKKNYLLAFLLVSFSMGAFAQTKAEKEQIIKVIQGADRKFESFVKKGMTDSIAGLFSPNCTLAGEFGTLIEDREKVAGYYADEKKAGRKYTEFMLKPVDQKIYDDIVLEMGTNTVKYTIGADKRLYTAEYNYLLIWKRSKNGPYQIRAAMWNLSKNPCAQ
jgi:hypothetical protein